MNSGPEPEGRALEEFYVYARREVISILSEIAQRRATVTLYYRDGAEFITTLLLQVNPEFEELVFDQAQDPVLNTAVTASRSVVFVTFLDRIKTQFSAQRVESTAFEGRPALRIRLPDSVLRLQRRNYFRVASPRGRPLVCEIPLAAAASLKLVIGDLSVGGVAMLSGPPHEALRPGAVFDDCRIDLPEHGVITTAIEIRNIAAQDGSDDSARLRIGGRFLNLSGPVAHLIQRYINLLERNRRAQN